MKNRWVSVVLLSTAFTGLLFGQTVKNQVRERKGIVKQDARVVGKMDVAFGASQKVKGTNQLEKHSVRFVKPVKPKGGDQRVFREFYNKRTERDLAALRAVLNPRRKRVYRPFPQWVDVVAGQNIPAMNFKEIKPGPDEIKLEGLLIITENAGRFRMRCEGNLGRVVKKKDPPDTGYVIAKPKFEWQKHWAAKVETMEKEAHAYCLEHPTDFGEEIWRNTVKKSFARLVRTPPNNPKPGHFFFVHLKAPSASVTGVRSRLAQERRYIYVIAHGKMFSEVSWKDIVEANAALIGRLGLEVRGKIPKAVVKAQIVKDVLPRKEGTQDEKEAANRNKVVEKVIDSLNLRHGTAKKFLKEERDSGWWGLAIQDWRQITGSQQTRTLIVNAINSKIALRDANVTHRELLASKKFGQVPNYFSGSSIQIGNCFGHGKDLVAEPLIFTKGGVEVARINYASAWRRFTVTIVGRAIGFHVSSGPYSALKKAKSYHEKGWKVVLVP